MASKSPQKVTVELSRKTSKLHENEPVNIPFSGLVFRRDADDVERACATKKKITMKERNNNRCSSNNNNHNFHRNHNQNTIEEQETKRFCNIHKHYILFCFQSSNMLFSFCAIWPPNVSPFVCQRSSRQGRAARTISWVSLGGGRPFLTRGTYLWIEYGCIDKQPRFYTYIYTYVRLWVTASLVPRDLARLCPESTLDLKNMCGSL